MSQPIEMRAQDPHPEGLSSAQERLADLLFTTKTVAPVRRRTTNPDGSFSFEKVSRPTSPVDFAQPGEFALKIHETRPDAPLSPIYVNLREMPEELVDQVGVVLAEQTVKDEGKPDFSTGIPKAGVSLAKAYAKHSGIPYIEVFGKEEGSDGKRSILAKPDVEGKGKSIRLIDDLATHGETKIEADEVAREMGFEVADVTVVVDRQQGAAQELEEAGIKFRAAITIDQLLKYGVRKGNITKEQYEAIQAYFTANAS